MTKIKIGLKERGYSVLIGYELLSRSGRFVRDAGIRGGSALIVSQKEIALYYQETVETSLQKEGFSTDFFITPKSKSSEASKSQDTFLGLIKKIASLDGKRKEIVLIALGGGVIGDLTGFAASVYRRGIAYVQIPTTLTAQVDSAIGGKTAIDLPEGKNLLGAIYQPRLVLSDLGTLNSLPERHWCDGFAEVVKYGVIKDASLFSLLEKQGAQGIRQNKKLLEKIIARSATIKAGIVESDEADKKNIRIVLNFGHTAGHAIEAASSYSHAYTHGEAVAIGMLIACDIGEALGILKDRKLTSRIEKTLVKFGLPLFYRGISPDAILKSMGYDKKTDEGKNRFVLPIALGKTTVVKDVPTAAILEALEKRKA